MEGIDTLERDKEPLGIEKRKDFTAFMAYVGERRSSVLKEGMSDQQLGETLVSEYEKLNANDKMRYEEMAKRISSVLELKKRDQKAMSRKH